MAGNENWLQLVAEYKGKKYMCTFDENGQYQDVSSNEQFYYHGGVQPDLGEKSEFYFLVFTVYDDVLAAAIPMKGITPDNYDRMFDAMIKKFESSPSYEKLSEYHLNRCAQIYMQENGMQEDEGDA